MTTAWSPDQGRQTFGACYNLSYPATLAARVIDLERIPIMLQYILHERRNWRHFGGQPSHELTDAEAKRIPETESPAKTPPFRTLLTETDATLLEDLGHLEIPIQSQWKPL
jgi:hypothetical protein